MQFENLWKFLVICGHLPIIYGNLSEITSNSGVKFLKISGNLSKFIVDYHKLRTRSISEVLKILRNLR